MAVGTPSFWAACSALELPLEGTRRSLDLASSRKNSNSSCGERAEFSPDASVSALLSTCSLSKVYRAIRGIEGSSNCSGKGDPNECNHELDLQPREESEAGDSGLGSRKPAAQHQYPSSYRVRFRDADEIARPNPKLAQALGNLPGQIAELLACQARSSFRHNHGRLVRRAAQHIGQGFRTCPHDLVVWSKRYGRQSRLVLARESRGFESQIDFTFLSSCQTLAGDHAVARACPCFGRLCHATSTIATRALAIMHHRNGDFGTIRTLPVAQKSKRAHLQLQHLPWQDKLL